MRRQLVPLADVLELQESIFQIVREGLKAMPDLLEREINLKPEHVAAVVRVCDDVLNKMAERVEEEELSERDVPDVEVQDRWVI